MAGLYIAIYFLLPLSMASEITVPIASPKLTGSIKLSELPTGVEFEFNLNFMTPISQVQWSLHSLPVEMGPLYLENCAIATKSPALLPRGSLGTPARGLTQAVENVKLTELLGHSLVLISQDGTVLACANLMPVLSSDNNTNIEIFKATLRGPEVIGLVFVFVLSDRMKIVSQLNTAEQNPNSKQLAWSLTQKWWRPETEDASIDLCRQRQTTLQPHSSEDSELIAGQQHVVTIRTDGALFNLGLSVLVLFETEGNGYGLLDCASFRTLTPLVGAAHMSDTNYIITQSSPFHQSWVSPPFSDRVGQWQLHNKPTNDCANLWTPQLVPPITIDSYVPQLDQDGDFVPQLTLFGDKSALLSTLSHRQVTQTSQVDCAVIRGLGSTVAVATFFHPIVGEIFFADTGDGSTLVFGKLRHVFDVKTSHSEWTIRKAPIGFTLDQLACTASDKILFNPTRIDERLCQQNPALCPVGALTEKLGKLIILPYNVTDDEYVSIKFVSDLPLTGPTSVVGNSLSVDIGWSKACANISLVRPNVAQANLLRYGLTKSPRTATFSIVQTVDWESVLTLEFSEEFRQEEAIKIEIHDNPIDLSVGGTHPCGWHSAGPVWKSGQKTLSKLLDLENGTIKVAEERAETLDGQLLSDTDNFLAKTVVLSSESQLICGTFLPLDLESQVTAVAHFAEPWVQGYVKIQQSAIVEGQIMPRTNAIMSAQLNSEIETLEWLIAGADQTELDISSCDSLSSHPYNPFFLALKNAQMAQICRNEWRLCALGDLSNRVGDLTTDRRRAFSVPMLPLSGPYSVIGKVLKVVNPSNSNQVACATIEQWFWRSFVVQTAANVTRANVQETLSDVLSLLPNQIEVSYNRTLHQDRCWEFGVKIGATSPILESTDLVLQQLNLNEIFGGTNCTDSILSDEDTTSGVSKLPRTSGAWLLLLFFVTVGPLRMEFY